MTVETAKENLLTTLESIDKSKLNLMELKLYAETLKIASEIQSKSYTEMLAETLGSGMACTFNAPKPPTVSEMREG